VKPIEPGCLAMFLPTGHALRGRPREYKSLFSVITVIGVSRRALTTQSCKCVAWQIDTPSMGDKSTSICPECYLMRIDGYDMEQETEQELARVMS